MKGQTIELKKEPPLPRECCGNCYFGKDAPIDRNNIGGPAQSLCRISPPKVLGQAIPDGRGGVGFVTSTAYPVQPRAGWCGDWKQRPSQRGLPGYVPAVHPNEDFSS